MGKKEIEVLKSEIAGQITDIDKIYQAIEDRKRCRNKLELESLCLWLHNLYCAFEDLLKIVAKAFENNIMDEERYHIALLKRMTVDIKGVRPALIGTKTFHLMDELRSFRHKIRHMYVFDIDKEKMKPALESALMLREIYQGDIHKFFKRLKG